MYPCHRWASCDLNLRYCIVFLFLLQFLNFEKVLSFPSSHSFNKQQRSISFYGDNDLMRRHVLFDPSKVEDKLVIIGDAASLCLFSFIQTAVDQFEPIIAGQLGLGALVVPDYELQVLSNPFVASSVVVSSWLISGLFTEAYITGASIRKMEETLWSVLKTFLLYIPCVTLILAIYSNGFDRITAPDFSFCAGILSIIGTWRFTLAYTIGR